LAAALRLVFGGEMTHHALKTANEHVNTYKQAHSHDDM
jgi:hypothetical protein